MTKVKRRKSFPIRVKMSGHFVDRITILSALQYFKCDLNVCQRMKNASYFLKEACQSDDVLREFV